MRALYNSLDFTLQRIFSENHSALRRGTEEGHRQNTASIVKG